MKQISSGPWAARLGSALLLAFATLSSRAQIADMADARARADRLAAALAAELSRHCPAAGPADQAAFDTCRLALYRGSQFKRSLQDFVLWGRQRDPRLTLKESTLTQFGPDVLSGMYLPLFMFDGRYSIDEGLSEGLLRIRLHTAFRNGLAPGQFPYPFWHDAEKWSHYEKANQIILHWDPKTERVKVAQFSIFGTEPPLVATRSVTPPPFDGRWRWTDAQGRSQPVVTVFDGLMDAANPYIGALDEAYKRLALRLRENQCLECHVPSNPDRSKRLVLLQTPMHAAAEIKRLMESVRKDRMPRDEAGIEAPLDSHAKAVLLQEGAAFERVLDQARSWEDGRTAVAGAATR
jgi:hypothetical protein